MPTYESYVPENQDDNGEVSTDSTNGGGSTDTFEEARGTPPVSKAPIRWPSPIEHQDRPRYDTPNCEGQVSTDRRRYRFLTCCNLAKTQCVYFKFTHYLCQLVPRFRGPNHPIQCCDNVPMEGGNGVECQNANNPFQVTTPSISTPFGRIPEFNIKVNLPDVPEPKVVPDSTGEGAIEGAPAVEPPVLVP